MKILRTLFFAACGGAIAYALGWAMAQSLMGTQSSTKDVLNQTNSLGLEALPWIFAIIGFLGVFSLIKEEW